MLLMTNAQNVWEVLQDSFYGILKIGAYQTAGKLISPWIPVEILSNNLH